MPVERYAYYVASEILHWEDRATEWSGLPDKIEIKVIIYDTKSGREISSAVLSGRSKWTTFGGDHPPRTHKSICAVLVLDTGQFPGIGEAKRPGVKSPSHDHALNAFFFQRQEFADFV